MNGGKKNIIAELTSVKLPDTMTIINYRSFYECTSLTSINIPRSVTLIGKEAFSGCTGLISVNIPYSVTAIKKSAFENCTGLTSVNIPDGAVIGENAFKGCNALSEMIISPDKRLPAGIFGDELPAGLIPRAAALSDNMDSKTFRKYILCKNVWESLNASSKTDIFFKRSGRAYMDGYKALISSDDCCIIADKLTEMISEVPKTGTYSKAVRFVCDFKEKLSADTVETICNALANAKKGTASAEQIKDIYF